MEKNLSSPVRISVYLQPRASRNEIVGMQNGFIKIRLTAPPVDGAANSALTAFIAEQLGVAKSRVRIVSGSTSRRKVVEVEGVSQDRIDSALR